MKLFITVAALVSFIGAVPLPATTQDCVEFFAAWQARIVLRRQHGDVVTACRQPDGKAFGVNSQPAGMRTIVSQYSQDLHFSLFVFDLAVFLA